MGINGKKVFNSELFFESVPDEFVDVPLDEWKYREGDSEVPIVLPRICIISALRKIGRYRRLARD